MTKLPSGFAFRKFELELNAETGQITRLKANPDEMPAVMQTLEAARNIRTMMSDRIAGRLEAQPAEPATQTNSGSEPVATAAHVAMTSPSGIFLGEAFEKYSRTQIHSGLWSEE